MAKMETGSNLKKKPVFRSYSLVSWKKIARNRLWFVLPLSKPLDTHFLVLQEHYLIDI